MHARAATPPSSPPAPINWSQVSVIFAIVVTLGGWIFVGGASATRIDRLEQDVEPLRQGDLRALQQDVAWIRQHLEREAGR